MQRPRSSRFHSGFDLTANHSALHRRILPDAPSVILAELVLSPAPTRRCRREPSLPEKQRTNHAPGSHIGFAVRQLAKFGKRSRMSRVRTQPEPSSIAAGLTDALADAPSHTDRDERGHGKLINGGGLLDVPMWRGDREGGYRSPIRPWAQRAPSAILP